MTLKTIALSITAVAGIAAATMAAADNSYFQYQYNLDNDSVLDLGTVRAEGAGVIEIYDYHRGQLGTLLGSESVHAGANADVRVNIGAPNDFDVIALLRVDGEVVATRDYDLN